MSAHESTAPADGLTLSALQRIILQMYGEKDAARGDAATFLWLTEEFGELATALRSGTHEELAAEMTGPGRRAPIALVIATREPLR